MLIKYSEVVISMIGIGFILPKKSVKLIVMKITLLSILGVWVFIALPFEGEAGETCGCDVSAQVTATYDQALLNADNFKAIQEHAPWGAPVDMMVDVGTRKLYQRGWITGYDSDLRMPVWVMYRLSADDLAQPRRRTQCFRPDLRMAPHAGKTTCTTYRGSGFDRGHMVPSADMTRSEQAMINSYVFSNIAPQHPNFNRGIWRKLETQVRALAREHGAVYVMSGAIFDQDNDGVRDTDAEAPRAKSRHGAPRAAIASHFYKVIAVIENTHMQITAWLLPHTNDPRITLAQAKVSLAQIEKLSGLDIFPLLPAEVAEASGR